MAAPGPSRPNSAMRKGSSMRPPPVPRPGMNRAQTATPTLHGRASPAGSMIAKQKSPKRKVQDAGLDVSGAEETNINVYVRCRGRNDREVKENSAVVVSSDGIKGKKVELSMGPNALSNKAYQFDKVFSPAADQGMIFEEVVTPILDNLLAGLNCTIFAYGQTGTGKTYTMSGDITDMLPIPDGAGIIPRVLHTLFDKLNQDETGKLDTTVKCSFIELYNEELRDLLAYDQNVKLKIFDDANKNGRTTTLVQGMEETHIDSASRGIQLLREGSHKRQVAATRCNDLSSRSHTVFTMTVYTKRHGDPSDEFISVSKLNLVDLAGSENIQRSGAENQRATEAGLINKSLLTLGRVINALVDRSSHIPYRESKLTRLLQDSLGGKTKTCIIATLSPAKSNLEETISTLDYAFRAKNIRNKPQMNQLYSKKTLLREFTTEIEKLKSELIATRHRNGFYLTATAYEELTTESESRRILSEEQRDKIETMESNLRNKVQELYALTTSFHSMKRENEKVQGRLASTRDILDKTEIVLAHAKRSLSEQTQLRKAHQETEEKLHSINSDMRQTLELASGHAVQLHQKIDHYTELHEQNASKWQQTTSVISNSTQTAETQLHSIHLEQTELVSALEVNIRTFVQEELAAFHASHQNLQQQRAIFAESQVVIDQQGTKMQEELDVVLGEVHGLRENVKDNVGAALRSLTDTAQRIGSGIAHELDAFHAQMDESHMLLKQQLQASFSDLTERMRAQQMEIELLRKQNADAAKRLLSSGDEARKILARSIAEEQEIAKVEREELVSTIGRLLHDTTTKQDKRLASHVETANKRIKISESEYQMAQQTYEQGVDAWSTRTTALRDASSRHREKIGGQLDQQMVSAKQQLSLITATTDAVHHGTIQAVDTQMSHMDAQLSSLDKIVVKIKAQNEQHQQRQTTSLQEVSEGVQRSYNSMDTHLLDSQRRTEALGENVTEHYSKIRAVIDDLRPQGQAGSLLVDVRQTLNQHQVFEYESTGKTPARTTYSYPDDLPHTEPHDVIIDNMRGTNALPQARRSPTKSPIKKSPVKRVTSKIPISPTKTLVYTDTASGSPGLKQAAEADLSSPSRCVNTLQDIDVNIISVDSKSKSDGNENDGVLAGKLGTVTEYQKQPARPAPLVREDSKTRKTRPSRMMAPGLVGGRENLLPGPISLEANGGNAAGRTLRRRGFEQM